MKYLLMLSLLVTMQTLSAKPLLPINPTDTIPGTMWAPISDIIKLYTASLERNTFKDETILLKGDTASLGGRIRSLQAAIAAQEDRIKSYQRDSVTYNSKARLDSMEIRRLGTDNRKLRRKVRWAGIAGAVGLAAAIILPLIK